MTHAMNKFCLIEILFLVGVIVKIKSFKETSLVHLLMFIYQSFTLLQTFEAKLFTKNCFLRLKCLDRI